MSTLGRGQAKLVRGSTSPRTGAVSIDFEVPFHDVDAMGLVWHGHYYKYLELARTALLRACDLDVRYLKKSIFGFVMIESGCRHTGPLHYGDPVRVSAWIQDTKHRIHIRYEVTHATSGKRVARGHTILATVDRWGQLLFRTPHEVVERLTRLREHRG